jgi:hypothetical protein
VFPDIGWTYKEATNAYETAPGGFIPGSSKELFIFVIAKADVL